jgi:hypothetical protein
MSFAEQGCERGEKECVVQLCKCLKLPPIERKRLDEIAKKNGRFDSSLKDFRELLPDFPIHIVYRPQKDIRSNASLGSLFPAASLEKQWFIRALLDARTDALGYGCIKPIGLMIKWPGMVDYMLVHTASYPARAAGLRLVYTPEAEDSPTVTVEPLPQFFASIKEYF